MKPLFEVFYPRDWQDEKEREEYELFLDDMVKIL